MSDVYQVTLEAPVAIIEKDSRRSDEVKKRLEQIDNTLTLTDFERNDLWAEVNQNDYWRDWRYESLKDYIKKSGVDLSPREVDYRIKESKYSKLLEINKTSRGLAKMSKLKLIYTLDPNATAIESGTGKEEPMSEVMIKLVADAPNKTLKELKKIVDQLQGVVEEEEGDLVWLNLPVRRDARAIVEKAIELACTLAGNTIDAVTKEEKQMSQAAALEKIAADFMSDPNNTVDEFDNEDGDFEDSHDDSGEDDSQDEDIDDYDPDDNGGGFDVAGK